MSRQTGEVVRTAMGAGRWFPGSGKQLSAMVGGFVNGAEVPKIGGRIVGAIAPHAGYIYSGKVAGYTFRALRENAETGKGPETVVVLGFSHSGGFTGVALMDGDALETPLGKAALDKESVQMLAAVSPRITVNYAPHAGEHSAENEVPFVQAALPGAKLVVGLMGDHDERTLNDMTRALGELAKKKRLLVIASTDLLHDADYDLVRKTDLGTLDRIKAMDDRGLAQSWSYARQVCCGIGPVLTVMRFAAAQGCKQGTVLHYRNSGDDYPESRGSWVVGYGAVVFCVD